MYQMKKGGSKQQAAIAISMKAKGKKPKMAKGGSFPDLTGDGKVTQADILKGRGVFKKGGMVGTSKKMKKMQMGGQGSSSSKATSDSTKYFTQKVKEATKNLSNSYSTGPYSKISEASNKLTEADRNLKRQKLKGKPGYDANGRPIQKQKMGGSVKGKKK